MTITIKQETKGHSYRNIEQDKSGLYIVGLYHYGITIKRKMYRNKKSALNYYYSLKKGM